MLQMNGIISSSWFENEMFLNAKTLVRDSIIKKLSYEKLLI